MDNNTPVSATTEGSVSDFARVHAEVLHRISTAGTADTAETMAKNLANVFGKHLSKEEVQYLATKNLKAMQSKASTREVAMQTAADSKLLEIQNKLYKGIAVEMGIDASSIDYSQVIGLYLSPETQLFEEVNAAFDAKLEAIANVIEDRAAYNTEFEKAFGAYLGAEDLQHLRDTYFNFLKTGDVSALESDPRINELLGSIGSKIAQEKGLI